jgi:hypothetical protein
MDIRSSLTATLVCGLVVSAGAAQALGPLPMWAHVGIASALSLTAIGMLVRVVIEAMAP